MPVRYKIGSTDAAVGHFTITPSDIEEIPVNTQCLFVTAAGDLVIEDANGVSITYAVDVGPFIFRPNKVMATGTTATVVGWR